MIYKNLIANLVLLVGVATCALGQSVIWSNDFSDTTQWSYVGGLNEWEVDTVLSPNLISHGFDTALNSPSGGLFAYIDSDIAGDSAIQDAFLVYNQPIDCSQHSNVQLTFVTYLFQFQDEKSVEISVDSGANWQSFALLTEFGVNSGSPNGYRALLDITAVAANQSHVQLRFRYQGGHDWFWAIDDIALVSCDGVSFAITDTIVDSLQVGSVSIGVSGGIAPYSFSWTGPFGFSSTQQNISGLVNQGDYTVIVVDSVGCSATHTSTVGGIVTIQEPNQETKLQMYPNPAQDFIWVTNVPLDGIENVTILNMIGAPVQTALLHEQGKMAINIHVLKPGVYLLRIRMKNGEIYLTSFIKN